MGVQVLAGDSRLSKPFYADTAGSSKSRQAAESELTSVGSIPRCFGRSTS